VKINTSTSIAVAALLGSLSANAAVTIFQDTFNTADTPWGNVTNDLAARQAGGTTSSTYSLVNDGDPATDSVIFEGHLMMRIANTPPTNNIVSLDTDFGPSLLNKVWTLSFSQNRTGTGVGNGWSGFAVGTNSTHEIPFAGFGLIIRGTGGGGWTAFNGWTVVGGGTFPEDVAHEWYDITATFNEASNTVSVVMDHPIIGVENLGTFPTDFGTSNSRFVGFRNFVDLIDNFTEADLYTDDLQIEVLSSEPPPEIGDVRIEILPGTNALALTWFSGLGYGYTVESKSSLLIGGWETNRTGIFGTGGDVTVTTAVDQAKSFYRVIGE